MTLTRKLRAFLDSHGIRYADGRQSFVTDCISPSCGKERHMYVRKSDGQSICFKCGSKWNWKRLVAAITGCRSEEAYSVLNGRGAGDVITKENPLDPDLFTSDESRACVRSIGNPIRLGPDFIDWNKSPRAMRYLFDRGVKDVNLLDFHDVRYHAAMDAVVFPVKEKGKTYGWQCRKIDPKPEEPKTITMPRFDKSKFLMGTKDYWSRMCLVEGPFDMLHVDVVDSIGGVAIMGKTISQDQIKLILDSPATEIYIGLDRDAAEQVYEIVDALGFRKKVFRIQPPEGKDFGDCTPDEVKEAMDKAFSTTALFLEVYLKEV